MPAEILTNFEAIGDMVGALSGIGAGLDDQAYVEGLIKSAHGHAATAFDIAAAATAKTGHITHVYEYGVMGVTRGEPRMADPTAPNARLYFHTLLGEGGNMDIAYSFRPARQPNPKPTPEDTGVSSEYISRLSDRKYYFYNKALVMETGRTVTIRPKNGDFLFVPFYGEPSRDPTNSRGYMMWNSARHGPLFARPGASSKGQFSAFWMNWWQSAGSAIMFEQMEKSVTMDIDIALAEASKRAQSETMKPVQGTNMVGAISSAKAIFNKMFKAVTAKRNETKTL
jgi:hypothetical protein